MIHVVLFAGLVAAAIGLLEVAYTGNLMWLLLTLPFIVLDL